MIKIFEMNDCDWWAGETLDEVISAYSAEAGISREEVSADAHELSDEAMDDLVYYPDGNHHGRSMSFRKGLAERIAEGETFPCLFATTEF